MDPPIKNRAVGDWRLSSSDFLESFFLLGAADKCDTMKDLHLLARDCRVAFNEDKHEYWIAVSRRHAL